MRIEIAAVLVASSRLIFIKTSSLAKSLFGAFLVYSLVFTYGISPFIIKALVESLGYSYFPTPLFFQDFFVAFSFVLLAIVAIVLDRERISAQKSPSLELRKLISCSSLFYFLLFALGLLYAAETTAQAFNPLQANIAYSAQGFFKLLIVLCALIWGVLFCSQASSSSEMDNLSLASLALCLTASALCSFQVFFFLSLLVGCSYLAYLSPLNLNRISLLAALLFGFQALVLVLLGYTTVSGFLQLSAQELGILLGVTLIAIPVLTLLRVVWRQRKITNSNEAKSV